MHAGAINSRTSINCNPGNVPYSKFAWASPQELRLTAAIPCSLTPACECLRFGAPFRLDTLAAIDTDSNPHRLRLLVHRYLLRLVPDLDRMFHCLYSKQPAHNPRDNSRHQRRESAGNDVPSAITSPTALLHFNACERL